MSTSHTGMSSLIDAMKVERQLATAKAAAISALSRYQLEAPNFFASFTEIQREIVADWMAHTFLDGIKYGLESVRASLSDEEVSK